MKTEAIIMTIDFGKNHFNAIYLNNQLRIISPDGTMITINDKKSPAKLKLTEKIFGRAA